MYYEIFNNIHSKKMDGYHLDYFRQLICEVFPSLNKNQFKFDDSMDIELHRNRFKQLLKKPKPSP